MKINKSIPVIVLTAAAAAATTYIICTYRKVRFKKRLAVVSEAGYETAYDIHYPLKSRRQKSA